MLRVLFILLAVVSIALAIVLGQPVLYLVAFGLLVAAAAVLTLNMRRKHQDVPETFMQAPEQPEEDLSSLGIMDIKPVEAGGTASSEELDVAEAPVESTADVSTEADPEEAPQVVTQPSESPSAPATAPTAVTGGISRVRTRKPKARIMVSEASDEALGDVLIPCLRSLRASVDGYTVCLLRQEDVPLRYAVEVMVSQNSYARNGGSYSAKEPMLSGHKALVPVVYPRVGPNGFPAEKLGYYHEPINVRQIAIVPVIPRKDNNLYLLVVDTMNEDGFEAASVRILLEHYARLVSAILDTPVSQTSGDDEEPEPMRPRREIIADEMVRARSTEHPLSLALVYLNRGEALSGDGVGSVHELEEAFSKRLRSVTLDARVERFGELTYGIFYHGELGGLANWAGGIKEAFPEDDQAFEGGVSVGVAVMQDRHERADELRSEATAALEASFKSGECIIVE